LLSIGLSEYEQHFADHGIDFSVLRDLTDKDLKELGVLLGHRRKMLRAIAELDWAQFETPTGGMVLAPRSNAERRHITVIFCDLVGSTALSAALDPEDMRELISAYQGACTNVIRGYGGFIARFMGDGVLAYFGYPRAHEDDAEQAVRAGLDIVAAVAKLETRARERLSARVSIATGLVVIGDLIGEGVSQEQAVVGVTPNVAARLQGVAEPGTVVIAASTRRLIGDSFKLRNLGRQELKGIAEPMPVWAIEGVSDIESRFEAARHAHLTDFIGRQAEINFLLERHFTALRGQGQVVLISGEAGIGKSRIAVTFSEHIATAPQTRLRYQCSPYHSNSALYPIIKQLERAAGFEPGDPPDRRLHKLEALLATSAAQVEVVAPLFAALLSIPFAGRYPPLGLSAARQRRLTFSALLEQWEGLSRQQPVLLLFEDVHWADATSLELLDLAIERIRRLPVLAILTFRSDFEVPWAGLPNVSKLTLRRLEPLQVQAMAEQIAGDRSLPVEVMHQIVEKSDGIPLFVEELSKTVLESGILVQEANAVRLDGELPPLAVPATLQDSLMARLDRLALVKEIAQIGAVVGREFSYSLLSSLAERDETSLKSALAQLEDAELIYRRGEPPQALYSFKHALLRDAAYESLLKSRRQGLHQRLAGVLRVRFPTIAETEPEVVAHHLTEAGLMEAAIEWWSKAGERALYSSAYSEAISHLVKALNLAEALPASPMQHLLRLRIQIAHGHALMHARGYGSPEMSVAFAQARKLAAEIEDTAERHSTYHGLWVGSFARGELIPMKEMAEGFLRDAQSRPESPEAGVAHRVFGLTCWFQGDYLGAQMHLEQAIALHNPERDRDLGLRFGQDQGVAAKMYLAIVLWPLGEVDRARHLAEDALALAQQSAHVPTLAHAHGFKGIFEAMRRDAVRTLPHAEAVLKLSKQHGLKIWLAGGTFYQGWTRWYAGDRESGMAAMREGMGLLREQQVGIFMPLFCVLQAEVEAQAGQIESTLALLDDELVEIERTGQHSFDPEVHRQRGELLLQRNPDNRIAAENAFVRAVEIARRQKTRMFELRAALSLAKLYQRTDRNNAALELLVPAIAGLREGPESPEVAEASRLLALLS